VTLRQKLREYFKFSCFTNNIHSYRELLVQMSPALRGQVACQTDNTWIASIKFFQCCPEEFLLHIALRFDQTTYPPEETVFSAGRMNSKLFVIKRGVLSMGGMVKTSGDVMCEDCLYKESVHGSSSKTLTFAIIHTLHRNDLLELIEEFPDTKRQFRRLAIKAIFRTEVLAYVAAYRRVHAEQDRKRNPEKCRPVYFNSGNFHCYVEEGDTEHSQSKGLFAWDSAFFGHNNREDHFMNKLQLMMVDDEASQRKREAACFLIQQRFKSFLRKKRNINKSRGRGLSRIGSSRAISFARSSRDTDSVVEEDEEDELQMLSGGIKPIGKAGGRPSALRQDSRSKSMRHSSSRDLRRPSFAQSPDEPSSPKGSTSSSRESATVKDKESSHSGNWRQGGMKKGPPPSRADGGKYEDRSLLLPEEREALEAKNTQVQYERGMLEKIMRSIESLHITIEDMEMQMTTKHCDLERRIAMLQDSIDNK